MFRQLAHIALIFCLLLVTSGMTVYQHYCHGNLVEASLLHPPKSCCDGPCDCCNDESHTYQLQEDYTFLIQDLNFDMPSFELPVQEFVYLKLAEESLEVLQVIQDHHPPDRSEVLALLQVYCL